MERFINNPKPFFSMFITSFLGLKFLNTKTIIAIMFSTYALFVIDYVGKFAGLDRISLAAFVALLFVDIIIGLVASYKKGIKFSGFAMVAGLLKMTLYIVVLAALHNSGEDNAFAVFVDAFYWFTYSVFLFVTILSALKNLESIDPNKSPAIRKTLGAKLADFLMSENHVEAK